MKWGNCLPYLYSPVALSKAESRYSGVNTNTLCSFREESVWADKRVHWKSKPASNTVRKNVDLIDEYCFTYSHSIVAGGLLLMSYTTRLMPFTLLMMSFEMYARKS